ncbi:MAG: outer membrane protein OmpW [endosymbiont of Galathealinum brachiosum]|uniref:Outer membrane protein OmpW n=1 Tax=endosymbiont of Galathealinum brachiosum TaxID=2200906 RepID=A0A370DCK1_9GAMM|nr:MAG: outer membrane protein OmpW [endosymbiont of Galathealinum brachiosum]
MKQQKTLSIAILTSLGLSLGAASFSAQAIQEGDMFMRVTATQVTPSSSSTGFENAPTVIPQAEDSTKPGFTFVYMMSNNIGFEVLAALPFEHDVIVDGIGLVGSTKQLPPTISVQYYFNPSQKFRPYVGIGLNYTTFFNDNFTQATADLVNSLDPANTMAPDLEIDDSFGLAAQIGFDYDLDDKWFVSADVRYINIETEAHNDFLGKSDIDINPTVVSVGLGYKF